MNKVAKPEPYLKQHLIQEWGRHCDYAGEAYLEPSTNGIGFYNVILNYNGLIKTYNNVWR